jgi:hypothetical protein
VIFIDQGVPAPSLLGANGANAKATEQVRIVGAGAGAGAGAVTVQGHPFTPSAGECSVPTETARYSDGYR